MRYFVIAVVFLTLTIFGSASSSRVDSRESFVAYSSVAILPSYQELELIFGWDASVQLS